MMTYREALTFLESTALSGDRLGLSSPRALLERLGDPQKALRFVHVTGTNGKGSTAAFISSVLKSAGLRTGLYTSPAVFGYEERIRIDGKNISHEDFAECCSKVKEAYDEMKEASMLLPTLFEAETAIAMVCFEKAGCDIVILEVGMGGDLDATNVIDGIEAAVFAPISLDHTLQLGNTVKEIAGHKAGIIKQGCAVVSAAQSPEAARVLKERSRELGCCFDMTGPGDITPGYFDENRQIFSWRSFEDLTIHLAGRMQTENAALAILTALKLRERGFEISDGAIREGLSKAEWPGRFEIMPCIPRVILDGAHNPGGAARLRENLEMYFKGRTVNCVMSVFSDKDYDKIADVIVPVLGTVFVFENTFSKRALPPAKLKDTLEAHGGMAHDAGSLENAIELALKETDKEGAVLVFGSLSFLGEAKRIIKKKVKCNV